MERISDGVLPFYVAGCRQRHGLDTCWLTLDCPWRIQQDSKIIVGSDDYGQPATNNADQQWSAAESQTGHLREQLLAALLGEERGGEIFNTRDAFTVLATSIDDYGGGSIEFSGRYTLSIFPASTDDVQWFVRNIDKIQNANTDMK